MRRRWKEVGPNSMAAEKQSRTFLRRRRRRKKQDRGVGMSGRAVDRKLKMLHQGSTAEMVERRWGRRRKEKGSRGGNFGHLTRVLYSPSPRLMKSEGQGEGMMLGALSQCLHNIARGIAGVRF